VQNLPQFSPAADPEQLIDVIGGDRLAGSGFENEDSEVTFSEVED
jgi:hypothetical protein